MSHYHECPWCAELSKCDSQICVLDERTQDGTILDTAGCCRECYDRRPNRLGVHYGQDDDGRTVNLPRKLAR